MSNELYYDEYEQYGDNSQPFIAPKNQPNYSYDQYDTRPRLDAPQTYYQDSNAYSQTFTRRLAAPQPVAAASQPQAWPWYSLADLAHIAKPHEATPIAFDRRLVLTTRISLLVCLLAIFAYLGVASSKFSVASGGFFLLGGSWLQSGLDAVQTNLLWLVGANILYLFLSFAIMFATHNFRHGRPSLHFAIYGQTLLGGLNILLFSLTLAIIVINVVIWLIIAAICISLLIGLFSSARR